MSDVDHDQAIDPKPARPVRKPALVLLCLFVIAGVGVIGFGLAWTFSSLTYVTGNEINGIVIRTLQRPNGGIRPEVEYEVEGRRFVTKAMCWTTSSSYRIGDQVRVFYKPDDPASAKLDSFLELWSVPLALSIFGIGTLAVNLTALRKVFLRRKLASTPSGTNEPET